MRRLAGVKNRRIGLLVAVIMIVAVIADRSSADTGLEAPGGFLVVPAVVLGTVDFVLLFGNLNDSSAGEASKGRGVLGVVFGSATVLTAVGLVAGTEANSFGIAVGVVGLATIGSGAWAIKSSKQTKSLSLRPIISRRQLGFGMTWSF